MPIRNRSNVRVRTLIVSGLSAVALLLTVNAVADSHTYDALGRLTSATNAGRLDIPGLRTIGRTAGGIVAGTVATAATIFEGFYDLRGNW